MTGSLNMGSNRMINLADATSATDGLNRQAGDARYYQNTTRLNQITVPNNSVSMNGQLLRNVADPLGETDAVNLRTLNQFGQNNIQSSYDIVGNSGAFASVAADGTFSVYHGNQLNLLVNDVSGTDTSRTKTYWENGNALPIVITTDQAKIELNQNAVLPNRPIRYDSVTQTFAGADNTELLTKATINT